MHVMSLASTVIFQLFDRAKNGMKEM